MRKACCAIVSLLIGLVGTYASKDYAAAVEDTRFIAAGLKPQNTQGIRDQFVSDLFAGGARFTLPLVFPGGPRNLRPQLTLTYDSNNRDGFGPYGYGWDIAIPRISRASRDGVNNLYKKDLFTVAGEDLIALSPNLYRSKDASDTTDYTRTATGWTAYMPNGIQRVYGFSDSARLRDPQDSNKIAIWMLENESDLFGNRVEYTWIRDSGMVYPDKVRYAFNSTGAALYEVRFEYVNKTHALTSLRTQFPVKTAKLLSSVKLFVNGVEARGYKINYDSTDTAFSHLTSVTEISPATTLPAVRFEYGSASTSHLLTRIDNGRGGVIQLTYKPSTQYRREGAPANKMPLSLQTLHRVEYTDTVANQHGWVKYTYEGGHFYYDPQDLYNRQYVGFAQVTATDDTGRSTSTFFHQSQTSGLGASGGKFSDHISKRGRTYREETRDASGDLLSLKTTRWEHRSIGNDARWLVVPTRVVASLFYTGGAHVDTATTFDYDNEGNQILQSNLGYVTASPETGDFTDIDGDTITTVNTYLSSPEQHLGHYPASTETFGFSGELLARTVYVYDYLSGALSKGLLTAEIAYIDPQTTATKQYTYSSGGVLSSVTDPNGNVTTLEFDAYNLFPTKITNQIGWIVHILPDYRYGYTKEVTDQNGVTWQTQFDAFGREIEKSFFTQSGSSTTLTQTQYTDSSLPNARTDITRFSTGSGDIATVVTYTDGFNRPVQKRSTSTVEDRYTVQNTRYDTTGRTTFLGLPIFQTGSAYSPILSGSIGTYTVYDALDRVTRSDSPMGQVAYQYLPQSVSKLNERGMTTLFSYDASARLVQIQDALSGTTNYVYNGLGTLRHLKDAQGNIRAFASDGLGRITLAEDLHAPGATNYLVRKYQYDLAGNLLSEGFLPNALRTFTYDRANRVTNETFLDEKGQRTAINYTYDVGPFGKGLLTSTSQSGYSQSITYDVLGRVATKTIAYGTGGDSTYQFQFTYDLVGNPLTQTYPAGHMVRYGYTRGRLDTLSFNGAQIITGATYTPAEQITALFYANGLKRTFDYDPSQEYRLVGKSSTLGTNVLEAVHYTFDQRGNITQLTQSGVPVLTKTVSYTYDPLDRLTYAALTPGTGATINATWGYDLIGNLTSQDAVTSIAYGSGNSSANPHAMVRYGSTQYTYDARGNRANSSQGDTLLWNGRDQLIKYTLNGRDTTYLYDPGGIRVKKSGQERDTYSLLPFMDVDLTILPQTPLTRTQYKTRTQSGTLSPLATVSTGATSTSQTLTTTLGAVGGTVGSTVSSLPITLKNTRRTSEYLWFGNMRVATVETNGTAAPTTIYHLTDHIGSANIDLDNSGKILQISDTLPYGTLRTFSYPSADSTSTNEFLFATKRRDSESNMDYFERRYYDSDTTRFISQDPVHWEIGRTDRGMQSMIDPQLLNSYSYAKNNPVVYGDPTGENPLILAAPTVASEVSVGAVVVGQVVRSLAARIVQKLTTATAAEVTTAIVSTAVVGAAINNAGDINSGAGETQVGQMGHQAVPNSQIDLGSAGSPTPAGGDGKDPKKDKKKEEIKKDEPAAKKVEYKKPVSGKTGKEAATDVPSWAKGFRPYTSESGKEFAERVIKQVFGKETRIDKGPRSDFSKIQKWGDRGFE